MQQETMRQITPNVHALCVEQRGTSRFSETPIIDNISSKRDEWTGFYVGGLDEQTNLVFPEISRIRSINKPAAAYPRDLRRNL